VRAELLAAIFLCQKNRGDDSRAWSVLANAASLDRSAIPSVEDHAKPVPEQIYEASHLLSSVLPCQGIDFEGEDNLSSSRSANGGFAL
jgi:hypothetical protein